jgi:hypothetical protein
MEQNSCRYLAKIAEFPANTVIWQKERATETQRERATEKQREGEKERY